MAYNKPAVLSRALIEEFCLYIENGNTQKDSAALAGFSEAVLYKWLAEGKAALERGGELTEREALCVELVESLKRAESKFKAYHIQQITNASRKAQHWQASAWLLERKFPDEWGRKERGADISTGDAKKVVEALKAVASEVWEDESE